MKEHLTVKQEPEVSEHNGLASSSSKLAGSTTSICQVQRHSAACPHTREVSNYMEKFSGRQAEDSMFEMWLDDCEEATKDRQDDS